MYDVQNPVAPWGDSGQCCGQAGPTSAFVAWIEAHPWLALGLGAVALAVWNATNGSKR
jgi:hypothetical protein